MRIDADIQRDKGGEGGINASYCIGVSKCNLQSECMRCVELGWAIVWCLHVLVCAYGIGLIARLNGRDHGPLS